MDSEEELKRNKKKYVNMKSNLEGLQANLLNLYNNLNSINNKLKTDYLVNDESLGSTTINKVLQEIEDKNYFLKHKVFPEIDSKLKDLNQALKQF